MEFNKKAEAEATIPTSALPDIVFLLLIFFMVTTVFKEFTGLQVTLPEAKQITKLPGKRDVAYIWIDRTSNISIDDKIVDVPQIFEIMWAKRNNPVNPTRVTSLRVDRKVKMGLLSDVQEELRKADCLSVNYSAKPAS